MVAKKDSPKQIVIQNCNLTTLPSAKAQAQLALAEAMKELAKSFNVSDNSYGIFIEGDKHENH